MFSEKSLLWLNLNATHIKMLFRSRPNPKAKTKFILFAISMVLLPITLIGIFIGYARAYNRFLKPHEDPPRLAPLPQIFYFAMAVGGVLIGVTIFSVIGVMWLFWETFDWKPNMMLLYVLCNAIVTAIVFYGFSRWKSDVNTELCCRGHTELWVFQR